MTGTLWITQAAHKDEASFIPASKVEQGQAPDRIMASHVSSGAVDPTRPLCAYPKVAQYKGSGSTDEAANFVCKLP
jgi:hypothetical protein